MKTNKLLLLSLSLISIFSFGKEIEHNEGDNIQTKNINIENPKSNREKAIEFVNRLKNNNKLSDLFADNWTFIYREDNRCDGSTDGKIRHLKRNQIDTIIKLKVKNDGKGWESCDEKLPNSFQLTFDLKAKISEWDRFEISEQSETNHFYILGGGESDYIEIYFDENHLISKLEYKSEDPG